MPLRKWQKIQKLPRGGEGVSDEKRNNSNNYFIIIYYKYFFKK